MRVKLQQSKHAGIRVALLIFTSVGWPLPLHQQMGVQAAKVGLLVIFGTRPYCASVVSGPKFCGQPLPPPPAATALR